MIELYKRYTHTNQPGTISNEGIIKINNFIARQWLKAEDWQKLNPETSLYYLPQLPIDWSYVWLIKEGEYRGTFPKRVRSYYHKAHGLKCLDSFITELGNLARRYSESTSAYHFEFVNRFDWRDGDFGDSGSCFWHQNAGALDMLTDNGAWAIRFYDDNGKGFGRALVVMIESDLYVVFNGYGFYSDDTFIIARVIAQFSGLTFKRIDLMNNGMDNGTLWINGSGIGYIVGKPETVAGYSDYDFGWEDIYRDICYRCDRPVFEDDLYFGLDDNPYCQDCFYEIFDTCESCYETHWREDITHTGDHRYLCHDCLEKLGYEECADCHEIYRADDMTLHEDQWYCEQHKPDDHQDYP